MNLKMNGEYIVCLHFLMTFTVGYVISVYLPLNSRGLVTEEYPDTLRHVRERQSLHYHGRQMLPPWKEQRRFRRSKPHPNCGTWSSWINKHTPTSSDTEDFEISSPAELDNFCPFILGGTISEFECSDEKGEPFSGTRTSPDGHFLLTCSDVKAGANCSVVVPSSDNCPDLSMRYKCSCGPPPVVTSISALSTYSSTTPASSSLDNDSDSAQKTVNICGLSIAWWIFVLVITVTLFLFNILLSVILYKRALRKIKRREQDRLQVQPRNDKIHPIQRFNNLVDF